MAKNLTWEVPEGAWSNGVQANAQALTVVTTGTGPDSQQQESLDLVSFLDVEVSPKDFVWVERIVGQAFIFGINENLAQGVNYFSTVKERIHVGRTVHAPGDVPITVYEDPWGEVAAHDRFLWERTCWQPVFRPDEAPQANVWPTFANFLVPGMSPGSHPWSTHIDVRVGRALRSGLALGYTVSCIDVADTAYYVYLWLRLLVSRGG